ncbi:unnamed protein product [Clonostachys rosea]|uniref:Uncharacterized protein n=1 Tax=Bionectria ochroleuca TaxID=29856 RepID=A0ABY6UAZ6_BIOOC|nr:unnamed protein product [Clonostachys rosea]
MTSKTLIALDVGLSRSVAGKSFDEIISHGQVLKISHHDGKTVAIPMNTIRIILPDSVVYCQSTQRLFIASMGIPSQNDGSVVSIRVDGSDAQTVLSKGQVHTPKQLALDTLNNKLYVADREGMRVLRCDLDGSNLETLAQTCRPDDTQDPSSWCVGIAVSAKLGVFYWTQKGPSKGGRGRLFCSSIEAEGRREPRCLLDNLPEPIDLYVDESNNILYWTDRGELPYGNTFNKIQLDATGLSLADEEANERTGLKHEIIVQNLNEAIGLAFDEEDKRWFVSDLGGTIWSFDQDGNDKTVFLQDEERAFTGIAFLE